MGDYIRLLDAHGSFAFAWTQAAHDDPEIRRAGTTGHLRLCRRMGVAMGAVRGEPFERPAEQGLLIFSMLERTWSCARLYSDVVDADRLLDDLTDVLADHPGFRRTSSRSRSRRA